MNKHIKPPFLSTSFSESGSNAKNRLDNILGGKRKRVGVIFVYAVLMAALCLGALVACRENETVGANPAPSNISEPDDIDAASEPNDIDAAVASAILAGHESYADAEFWAEGHVILGSEGDKVYAVTSIGGYSFMNGMFIKDSGSGAIPVVITLNADGGAAEVEYPKDGSMYDESLREMFPKKIYAELILGKDYYEQLIAQEHAQAKEYISGIGREAEVGDYRDLNAVLPDMSTEASNTLLELQKYGSLYKYPMYIGNVECVEDGVRYIYATVWNGNKSGGKLTYQKTNEGHEVVEQYVFNVSGDEVEFSEAESTGNYK